VNTYANPKDKTVFSEGGEVIVPSSGETAEEISRASVVVKSGIILGSDLNIIKTDSTVYPSFLAITISNGKQQKELSKRAQGKSVVHIGNSVLKEIVLNLPNLPEQTSIGNFFHTLDNLITLHKRKLDSLKQLKMGYLQNMFPHEGENAPKIRFVGFTDDWEKKKLGEIYEFKKGKDIGLSDFVENGKYPSIAYGHLYTEYTEVISKVHFKTNKIGVLGKANDLLFPGSSTVPNGTAQANSLQMDDVQIGGDVIIARPREIKIDSNFTSYMINSNKKILYPIITGTTISHMYGKDLAELNYLFPKTKTEQINIGNFFCTLDEQITTQKIKLDKLKQIRTAYLQKMFV